MKKRRSLILVLMTTALVGLGCLPTAAATRRALRNAQRGGRSSSRRSRRSGSAARLLPGQELKAGKKWERNRSATRARASAVSPTLPAISPTSPPTASLAWLSGEVLSRAAFPRRYLLFCSFLI
jgi:hypothetical protein